MLQNISPGELQSAKNALDFARELVTRWLATYKFRNWIRHSSTGVAVTAEDRERRAAEIAEQLCSHQKWLSHSRSIRLADLQKMRLQVTDFTKAEPELGDAISRYNVLMRMTFHSQVYKLIETIDSQIYKHFNKQQVIVQQPGTPPSSRPLTPGMDAPSAVIDITCRSCGTQRRLQLNFEPNAALAPGAEPLPLSGPVTCKNCGNALCDAADLRKEVEQQAGREVTS